MMTFLLITTTVLFFIMGITSEMKHIEQLKEKDNEIAYWKSLFYQFKQGNTETDDK